LRRIIGDNTAIKVEPFVGDCIGEEGPHFGFRALNNTAGLGPDHAIFGNGSEARLIANPLNEFDRPFGAVVDRAIENLALDGCR
jgi:hypothetical protein